MTSYKLAAIDVHKKMLAVVVADVAQDEWELERRKFGTAPSELKMLEEWLATREVREAIMESTAQYSALSSALIGRVQVPPALG